MKPDAIEGHARTMRKKIQRLKETVGFESFKPLQEVFSMADDLCELIIALAQNQQLASLPKETALDPPADLPKS